MSPLIDAHTHLDACGAKDADDVHAIVDRAAAVGVTAVVTIADDLASARWVTQAAEWDPRVYAAVALHPTRADALGIAHALRDGVDRTVPERQLEGTFIARSDSTSFKAMYKVAETTEWLTPVLWTGLVRSHGAPTISLVGNADEIADGHASVADSPGNGGT